MPKNDKKVAVLLALKGQIHPVTLLELLGQLGEGFYARSVRRWLAEMVVDGTVSKTGEKRATKYQAVAASTTAEQSNFHFGDKAMRALRYVQKPLFDREPITYQTKWLGAYQPNHTFYLTAEQRTLLQRVGKPRAKIMPSGTYAHHFYHRLLIDLSYNSSRLEGNTYSLGETEKLLIEGIASAGKLDAEKTMILNHKEAIRYLVDNATHLTIHYDTICTLHYLLSDGLVLSKYAGKMRDHAVKISSSSYIPIENPDRLKNQLIHICDIAKKIQDAHEQSFFLLVQISYLQAFTDVNKRTARLSANIPLLKNNLYPIAFNCINKEDYISAMLAIYEKNDTAALAELYAFSYRYTCREYEALFYAMGFDEVRVRFRQEIRQLIRNIITHEYAHEKMNQFILSETQKRIPESFRTAFINSVYQELENIGPERIGGLGITQQQLEKWLQLR